MKDTPPDKPARKRLNADQKRALQSAEMRSFVQQYERKAQRGVEPNDRRYNRKTEKAAKAMRPEDLDRLMREDD